MWVKAVDSGVPHRLKTDGGTKKLGVKMLSEKEFLGMVNANY